MANACLCLCVSSRCLSLGNKVKENVVRFRYSQYFVLLGRGNLHVICSKTYQYIQYIKCVTLPILVIRTYKEQLLNEFYLRHGKQSPEILTDWVPWDGEDGRRRKEDGSKGSTPNAAGPLDDPPPSSYEAGLLFTRAWQITKHNCISLYIKTRSFYISWKV